MGEAYLVFLVFKANPFAVSQESTFCYCLFAFSYSSLYESPLKNSSLFKKLCHPQILLLGMYSWNWEGH